VNKHLKLPTEKSYKFRFKSVVYRSSHRTLGRGGRKERKAYMGRWVHRNCCPPHNCIMLPPMMRQYCTNAKWGRWKWRTWKWRTITIARHEIAGHENARHDKYIFIVVSNNPSNLNSIVENLM